MRLAPAFICAASLVAPLDANALEHPPVLEEQSGCEDWMGSARGNDPSVRLNLQLCPTTGGEVRGFVQWSSLQSGWNLRAVEGRWRGESLTLRDVALQESHPMPGWRFCLIETWRLEREGNRLVGTYSSAECRDDAAVTLDLMERPEREDPTRAERLPPTRPSEGDENNRADPPVDEPAYPRGPPHRPVVRDLPENVDPAPAASGAGCGGCHVDYSSSGLPEAGALGWMVLGLRRRRPGARRLGPRTRIRSVRSRMLPSNRRPR